MMCGCIDDGCMHGNMDWWIAACKDGWMHEGCMVHACRDGRVLNGLIMSG